MSTPWITAVTPKAFRTSRIATEAIHSSQAGTTAVRIFFFVFSAVLAGGGWTISRTKSSFFRPPKCKPDLVVVGDVVGTGAT
jgi:hypothetical protein